MYYPEGNKNNNLNIIKLSFALRNDKCNVFLPFSITGVKDDDTLFKKPREVVHKNTRFIGDPFSKALNKSQIQQAAALNAQVI